jgi:hypothetical protein
MDLSDPTRAISSTLDGSVLAVLAGAGRALTAGEIAELAPRGTEVGIRRSVDRLVLQGIVIATQMGRNRVHELNREHIAAPAAEVLSGLRLELWRRLRERLGTWDPAPTHAWVYGSAARGDGDENSDIDVLLVRPLFQHDGDEGSIMDLVAKVLALKAKTLIPSAREDEWDIQTDRLHDQVRRWTGNSLHIVELTALQWWRPAGVDRGFKDAVEDEGIALFGDRVTATGAVS